MIALLSLFLGLAMGAGDKAGDKKGSEHGSDWSTWCEDDSLGDRPFRRRLKGTVGRQQSSIFTYCAKFEGDSVTGVYPSRKNKTRDPMAHQMIRVVADHSSKDSSVGYTGSAGLWKPVVLRQDLDSTQTKVSDNLSQVSVASKVVAVAATAAGPAEEKDKSKASLDAAKSYVSQVANPALKANAAIVVAQMESDFANGDSFNTLMAKARKLENALAATVGVTASNEEANAKESSFVLPSLLPGPGSIRVSGKDGSSIELPMSVQESYIGSVRVGVAVVSGPASNREYTSSPSPDSTDVSVITASSGQLDSEFVLGYSQLIHRRGATQTGARFAINFALGVIDINEQDVSAFKSVYMGGEFGWDNLSVAVCGTVRKVPTLNEGLRVGEAVSPNAAFTTESWQPGVALVFYPTPELLRRK